MNQEKDKILTSMLNIGNMGELVIFNMQLALNDLFRSVRLDLQEDPRLVVDKFPILDEKYRQFYNQADSWMRTASSE